MYVSQTTISEINSRRNWRQARCLGAFTKMPTVTDRNEIAHLHRISVFVGGFFYIIPVFLLLGICGNSLSLVIFVRARKRAEAPIQYLSLLAVSDTGVILSLGVVQWLVFGLSYVTNGAHSYNVSTMSIFACKFLGAAIQASGLTSAWVIATFSVERAFIVWFPLKRVIITKTKRKITIFTLIVLSILFSIHRSFQYNIYIVASRKGCYYTSHGFVWFQYDTAMHNYIPCCCITIANALILIGVRHATASTTGKVQEEKKSTQDRRILISLLLVSTLYVVFMMPASVTYTYFLYLQEMTKYDETYLAFIDHVVTFFDQFSMLNYCFNFLIYGFTLPFFRDDLRKMCMVCRCRTL
jgi:hypothetical protein